MRILSVLCLLGWLAMTSTAAAKPSKKHWAAAEAALRDHFKAQSRGILDVGQEPINTLGTAFWVRWEAGGGGLVIVRDKDVFATKDLATITAILKRDDFLKTRQISADDFLYLLQQLGSLPKLETDPIKGNAVKALNPAWTFSKDGAVFTMYANRTERAGDRNEPVVPVTRAILTVRSDYTLAAWVTEDTLVKVPRER
jgi:hypothetical protein